MQESVAAMPKRSQQFFLSSFHNKNAPKPPLSTSNFVKFTKQDTSKPTPRLLPNEMIITPIKIDTPTSDFAPSSNMSAQLSTSSSSGCDVMGSCYTNTSPCSVSSMVSSEPPPISLIHKNGDHNLKRPISDQVKGLSLPSPPQTSINSNYLRENQFSFKILFSSY